MSFSSQLNRSNSCYHHQCFCICHWVSCFCCRSLGKNKYPLVRVPIIWLYSLDSNSSWKLSYEIHWQYLDIYLSIFYSHFGYLWLFFCISFLSAHSIKSVAIYIYFSITCVSLIWYIAAGYSWWYLWCWVVLTQCPQWRKHTRWCPWTIIPLQTCIIFFPAVLFLENY